MCNLCLPGSGLPHSEWLFPAPFITWKLHNFIFLTNIITIYCVVMHFYQLMDIWASYLSWRLWAEQQWAWRSSVSRLGCGVLWGNARSGAAWSRGRHYFSFLGTPHWCFQSLLQFARLLALNKCFPFPHPVQHLLLLGFTVASASFCISHSDLSERKISKNFNLHG